MSPLETTAARRAVLERFLLLADRTGEWEGVNGFAKAAILRHARRDPDQTFARLQGLVSLWQAAQEDPDGRGPEPAPGAGGRRLERHARPAGGADRRAAGGPPRADTTAAVRAFAYPGAVTGSGPGPGALSPPGAAE